MSSANQSSTGDPPPSNSQPSDASSARTASQDDASSEDVDLTGEICSVDALTETDRAAMRSLMADYFENVSDEHFRTDLDEKEQVILLRDDRNRIRGFSTMMRFTVSVDGQEVVGIFSGDTIIDRACWGTSLLPRLWARLAFRWSDAVPHDRVYWLLLSAGYKTYRFLPVFFDTFYPTRERSMPLGIRRLRDALAAARYPEAYDPSDGVVRFEHPTPLRENVAPPTERRRQNPHVAFFLEANPGYTDGDELVCLTQVIRSNLTRAGRRMVASA